jgi:hypothetical protein
MVKTNNEPCDGQHSLPFLELCSRDTGAGQEIY